MYICKWRNRHAISEKFSLYWRWMHLFSYFFSFNALTAFLCVAKSWTLSKNQMLVWPSISCYLQLPQPQAAQYFSSFLSALPIFFRILFYFMSYFTCFVYQFIHPNILALFFQPSQYSLEYFIISCLISHVLLIN